MSNKIISNSKEHIKKINIFGVDVSLAWSTSGWLEVVSTLPHPKFMNVNIVKDCNFLYDKEETDGIITTTVVLLWLKIEVKQIVEHNFKFA